MATKLAIVDPVCDNRELQRSPARRVLLKLLLDDPSFYIDYYSCEDLWSVVHSLPSSPGSNAKDRFRSIPRFNPIWSSSPSLRRWDRLLQRIAGRYLALERGAQRLGCKMLVAQVKNDLRRAGASYDVVIAVNDLGLVASEAASGNSALVYYSLEVYNEGNVHITWDVWRKRIKQRERIQFSKIRYLLIQDEDRARLMFDDMKQPLDLSKFLQLPVTHPGRSRKERTMYLRDLFPELQNKFILLQQNVGWPRRSEEIAKMAKRADRRNFCIVFNGSLFPDCPDSYLQHKGFLDYHDLDKLVGSADIGLIFYLDDNENDALISHASGQLSHFAMLGVPVIASYAPSLERLMTKYKCGVIVKSVEEIYPAAEKIMKSYEQYCSGALACFDAEYDIANYRGAICTKFKNLGAEG